MWYQMHWWNYSATNGRDVCECVKQRQKKDLVNKMKKSNNNNCIENTTDKKEKKRLR